MDIHTEEIQFDEPSTVLKEILSADRQKAGFTLSVQCFREVFLGIQQEYPGTPVDIVLNGDWAMAQFSRISNQRIRILPVFTTRLRHIEPQVLSEDDFDFAALYATFYGARKPLSFLAFLREELSANPFKLLIVFLATFFIFFLISSNGNITKLIPINELIITSITLFLSIFLLFTVSQNLEKSQNLMFFSTGLTHRFFSVDRYVAIIAILALLLGFFNVVLAEILPNHNWALFKYTIQTPDSLELTIIASLSTALATTLLVDSFLALTNYYFYRVRYLVEQELTRQLLDSTMKQRNSD